MKEATVLILFVLAYLSAAIFTAGLCQHCYGFHGAFRSCAPEGMVWPISLPFILIDQVGKALCKIMAGIRFAEVGP